MKTRLLFIGALLLTSFCVSQAVNLKAELEEANFKFMLRGYCYAGSKIADTEALGGFGGSDNFPVPVDESTPVRKGELHLVAKPDAGTVFDGKYKGMKLMLINATDGRIALPAQDSRVSIIQEALDENGVWRPIEYLPRSWCGNSYHRVFLGSNEYWVFAAPRYAGKIKTKLRFKLVGNDIHSNEFEGSVNQEQFSVKQGNDPMSFPEP